MSACINICFGGVIVSWNSWFLLFFEEKKSYFFLWSSRVYRDTHKNSNKHFEFSTVEHVGSPSGRMIACGYLQEAYLIVLHVAWHAYDCLWYQSGNYSYLLRVAGRSDCAPAHFFMPIFKMRRKFWPRTMTTHLNMLKHLNKEIRRGKQTCKQAGKETSKNASVTKQTWGAKVETAIRMIRLQSNIFKTRNLLLSIHANRSGHCMRPLQDQILLITCGLA